MSQLWLRLELAVAGAGVMGHGWESFIGGIGDIVGQEPDSGSQTLSNSLCPNHSHITSLLCAVEQGSSWCVPQFPVCGMVHS